MNVQDECIKIHSKYGMSEMANYKIQLLFDSEIEKVKKEYKEKLHWIPVEEELPKNYSAVLAVLKSPSCTWVEEIGYGEGKFQLPGRGDTDFVTHWMYLPEPPPFL